MNGDGPAPSPPGGRYLQSAGGRLYLMHYPASERLRARYVIFVPPFAEEMNKSRRMWSLLAQRLQRRGYGVLMPDLYGTGDSEGDFSEARWALWREDLSRVMALANEEGAAEVSVCALRLGATLALDWLAGDARWRIDRLVLWQPVVSGATALTQFLRLRMAAGLRQQSSPADTPSGLRQRLASGASVEVAGYEFAPELVTALDALRVDALAPPPHTTVWWFEVGKSAEGGISPASTAVVAAWLSRGCRVTSQLVPGEQFWSVPEITVVEPLLERTEQALIARA